MTTQPKAVQPIPEGYHSVTPWIISRDTAKLLDFMSKALGAQELGRVWDTPAPARRAVALLDLPLLSDHRLNDLTRGSGWQDAPDRETSRCKEFTKLIFFPLTPTNSDHDNQINQFPQ